LSRIAVLHEVTDKGEIKHLVEVAIEVVDRHQVVERDRSSETAGTAVNRRAFLPIIG
jgi:hypothetical protein